MALILPVKGISPTMGNDCFIAPNATMVGDVVWVTKVLCIKPQIREKKSFAEII